MVNWSTIEKPLEEIIYEAPSQYEILSAANSLAFRIKSLKGSYSLRNYLGSHDRDELNRSIILLEAMIKAHGLIWNEGREKYVFKELKTLVIHPADKTTDFLKVVYENQDWTIITDPKYSSSLMKQAILAHERIICLGHGNEHGLFGDGRFMISSEHVYLLRTKTLVSVWCNADKFHRKYGLAGFFTGMIISEYDEAETFSEHPFTMGQILHSNELFAKALAKSIDAEKKVETLLGDYQKEGNPIIQYNSQRIYYYEELSKEKSSNREIKRMKKKGWSNHGGCG